MKDYLPSNPYHAIVTVASVVIYGQNSKKLATENMLEKYLNMTKGFASKFEGVLEIPALKLRIF